MEEPSNLQGKKRVGGWIYVQRGERRRMKKKGKGGKKVRKKV
jgi:hypothetical protein